MNVLSATIVFFDKWFKIQNSVCSGCHDMTVLCLNISNFAIITVKGVDYFCIIHGINRSDGIYLLKNSVLDDRWYIQNACQRNQY